MRQRFALLTAGAVLAFGAVSCARTDDAATGPAVTSAATTTVAPGTTSANPDKKTRLDHGTTSQASPQPTIDGIEAPALASLAPADPYEDWVEVTDDTGAITLEVPEAWAVDTRTRLVEEQDVPAVYSAEDEARYAEGFEVPGLAVLRYPPNLAERGATWALDRMDTRDRVDELCTGETTEVLVQRGRLTGFGDVAGGCGTDDAVVVHLALDMSSGPEPDLTVVQAQLLTTADLEVLDRALAGLEATAGAEDDQATPTTEDESTTTTEAAPGAPRAIQLVTGRVRACGFDASDAVAQPGWPPGDGDRDAPGNYTVQLRLTKAGQDYGTTEYVVNTDSMVVYAEGPTAKERCP